MDRREFLVYVSQLYQGESEKLEQLCQWYRIPQEIRRSIDSPIKLFFFLDIEENLCLKALAHNLKRSELYEMASYVENYEEKNIIPNTNNDNPTAKVVKILRDGLTLKNIYDLNYLLGTNRQCEEFDTLLIGLLTKSKFLDIDIDYIAKVLKIINHQDVAEKLHTYSKKKESLRVSWENDESKRLMLIKISQKLTGEDMAHLAFLFRLPIGIQGVTNPIDLFQYLEDRGELNLPELAHHLELLQKRKLIKELNEYIQNYKDNPNQIYFPSIFEEINDCLTKEDIFNLGFLLGSKRYPKTMTDYIIQLVEKGKIQNFEIKFLETALKQILRDDLIHFINNVVENQYYLEDSPPIVSDNTSIEGEAKRTQLLEISRNISTEELEKLSIIYNVPPAVSEAITMPIELFYYLERESQFDIDYLKMSLSSIQRNDLINILEPQ